MYPRLSASREARGPPRGNPAGLWYGALLPRVLTKTPFPLRGPAGEEGECMRGNGDHMTARQRPHAPPLRYGAGPWVWGQRPQPASRKYGAPLTTSASPHSATSRPAGTGRGTCKPGLRAAGCLSPPLRCGGKTGERHPVSLPACPHTNPTPRASHGHTDHGWIGVGACAYGQWTTEAHPAWPSRAAPFGPWGKTAERHPASRPARDGPSWMASAVQFRLPHTPVCHQLQMVADAPAETGGRGPTRVA